MDAKVCDRCNAVIYSTFNHAIVQHSQGTVKDKHLCMKCYTRAFNRDDIAIGAIAEKATN